LFYIKLKTNGNFKEISSKKVNVDFNGGEITSDTGLPFLRELEKRTGIRVILFIIFILSKFFILQVSQEIFKLKSYAIMITASILGAGVSHFIFQIYIYEKELEK